MTDVRQSQTAARLALVGVAAQALFTAAWVITALFEPRYSFIHNDTSDLGALTARHAGPYNVALSASGLLTLGIAFALVRVVRRRAAVTAGAILIGVFGIGQFIDGLAREDCWVSVNAACRAAEKAGRISTHHKVHNIESLVTFAALLLAPLVVGLACRSVPALKSLATYSFVTAAIQAVCLPTFLTLYSNGSNGQGLVEILELTSGVVWLAVLGLRLVSIADEPRAVHDTAKP